MINKDPLLDKDFLKALDQENQREIFAKIATLTFDEDPIEFITGRVTGGNINIDGQSSTRRTCSITLVAKELNIHDFYWGLNNKIMLFIGLTNKINNNYPDIIWFPQGIFLITDFSTNQTTNNYTVSISGRDKMSLLNGDIGGIITSLTADFGKIEEIDEDGIITITSIPLKDIVREVVHEYAREPFEKIIIENLDDVGLELMEYRGNEPMYFLINDETNEVSNMFLDISGKQYFYSINGGQTYSTTKIGLDWKDFIFDTRTEFFDTQETPTHIKDEQGKTYTVIKCSYGEAIGYRETDLTYAGELIGQVGNSIVQSCLEPIKTMLGNFEFFYDLEGRFHFRKKQTFIDISWNNLIEEEDSREIYAESTALTSPYSYSFENANLITSFQNKPDLKNLKNDYSIWGTKVTTGGNEYPVHLRYAIDKKPVYYKTFDGRVYSTEYRSYASIQKEATEHLESLLAQKILNHQKKELPYGLSDKWWEVQDWATLYNSLTHEGYPNLGVGNYSTGYDYLDLEVLFPGGISWDKTRPLHIFDVKNTENGDLNGPLFSVVHNPSSANVPNRQACGHKYTDYFVNKAQEQGFTSYIYNPKWPTGVESQINNILITSYAKKYHYNCEWREILYQMAKDYLKYEHTANFLGTLAENNPDYYPTGYTGYEMYYTDIVSFWREIYDPEYKYTKHTAYVTKSMYDLTPEDYFWFAKADERTAYDYSEIYYLKNSYDEYEPIAITEDDFYLNPTQYWYLMQGSQYISYDVNRDYFTKTLNDYNTKKFLGVEIPNSTLATLNAQTKDPSIVYYSLSDKKYFIYNTTLKQFEQVAETDDRLVQNPEFGWSTAIIDSPTSINFWFNFLDSADGSLTAYNVRNVGDRPKSINDTNVKAIYYRDTPTVVFLASDISTEEKIRQKKLKPGYTFILLPTYMNPLFVTSTQKKCTKDVLEEWLYQYTTCTESITIQALPVYYLEPNTRIFIHDENSGINGEYIINKISYQLTYNSTMSINATKAIDRIY